MKNGGERVMFDTIHHIAIIGSDYEKSKHFYVDLLGFKMIRENYRKERDDYKIDLVCGPQEIELFIIKNAPARVNYLEALGLRHLAFLTIFILFFICMHIIQSTPAKEEYYFVIKTR